MATTTPRARKSPQSLSPQLLATMESGVLTQEQLKELIEYDAAQLGMGYDDAVEAARQNKLPSTPLGYDLRLLVRMLVV